MERFGQKKTHSILRFDVSRAYFLDIRTNEIKVQNK